jgi:pimeloyl-ACP methyl ester carboxylesterase
MFVTVGGGPIWYVDGGRKSELPVVFIHGFPFSHTMWLPQLEAVGRVYRTIAYDLKGHGSSYVGDGQYMIEGHVSDLMALLDHLKIDRCVGVGLSMGGYILLRAIEKHPDRYLGAVLCDTRSEADSNEGKLKRYANTQLVKSIGIDEFASQFLGPLLSPETVRSRPEIVDAIRRMVQATQPLSIAGTLIALAARTDTTASLASMTIPALILVGEFDVLTPPAASEAMHQRISGSEMFIVPGAGHVSNLENPEFFNEKLLLYLKQVADTIGK